MEGFDHLLNWKLKAGSHPFPGKDGGTCINEAALVAAGFAYKPIRTVDDDAGLLLASDLPLCDAAQRLGLRQRPAASSALCDTAGLC